MIKLLTRVTGFTLAVASLTAIPADSPPRAGSDGTTQAQPSKNAREGHREGIKQEMTEWEMEIKQNARAIRREMHQKLAEIGKEMKTKSAQIRQEAREKLAALKKEAREKRAPTAKGDKGKGE